MKKLLLIFCLLFLVSCVHGQSPLSQSFDTKSYAVYNETRTMDTSNSTPWEMFWASGLIGFGMFIMSLRPRKSAMELEVDAIVCALALVPIAFCAWTATNVDRLVGYGVTSQLINSTTVTAEYVFMSNHIVYSFPVIQILMACLFIVCIGNLLRIIAQHKLFKLTTQDEEHPEENDKQQNI